MEIFLGWFIFSVGVGFLANARGRSGFGFFLVSALLSPLIGLIIVLVIRNPKEEEQKETIRRQEHERQLESIRAIAAPRPPDVVSRTPPSSPSISVADEIAKLGGLRDRGLLTDAEFQLQKSLLLSPTGTSTSMASSSADHGQASTANSNADVPFHLQPENAATMREYGIYYSGNRYHVAGEEFTKLSTAVTRARGIRDA